MTSESRHLSRHIDRPAPAVYDYVSQPAHITDWAPGLGKSIERVDDQWIVDSPMGRIAVTFAPDNDFGVVDHEVTLPTGETIHNPVRILPHDEGAEIVFTLRRQPDMTDEEFERDEQAVLADLDNLKRILEARG
jgi:uncharacterized protein YndB with AHSA1/START domain